jgi:hypothetical protein
MMVETSYLLDSDMMNAAASNMKKLLLILFKSLGFIVCILIGFIAISLLYDFVAGLPLFIALICVYIWLTRNDKDGIYRLFKDTHQSNLDDIERQELEEQEAEVIK